MKSIFFVIGFLISSILYSQTANWYQDFKGESHSDISHVVSDSNGDYFVLGSSRGGPDHDLFGDIELPIMEGRTYHFVSKISKNGEVLWAEAIINNGAVNNSAGSPRGFLVDEPNEAIYVFLKNNDRLGSLYHCGFYGSFVLVKMNLIGEVEWVESFYSGDKERVYNFVSEMLFLNEAGNIELNIVSSKEDSIHLLNNDIKLNKHSSFRIEMNSAGEFIQVLSEINNANVFTEYYDDLRVVYGQFVGDLSLEGYSFQQQGDQPNGIFSVAAGDGIVYQKQMNADSKVSRIQFLGDGEFLVSGQFRTNSFIWNGDTLFHKDGANGFTNSFLMRLKKDGSPSWFHAFSTSVVASSVSTLEMEREGDEVLVSFDFSDSLRFNGQAYSSYDYAADYASCMGLVRFNINDGTETSLPLFFGDSYAIYSPPLTKRINGKWLLLGDYKVQMDIGGVHMERVNDEYFPGSSFIMEFDDLTSMQESLNSMSNEDGLNPYANPSFGESTIDVPASFYSESLYLKITNEAGQLIEERFLPAGTDQLTLDLEGHPSGNYFVLLSNGTDSVTGKVVLR